MQEQLEPGGWFVNIDIALPDEARFTDWQFERWREWIVERERQQHRTDSLRELPDLARCNPDNKYASLSSQLHSLRSVGFVSVECLFRHGIFVLYCAQKPKPAENNPGSSHVRRTTPSRPNTLRIGLVGDYNSQISSHRAITRTFELLSATDPALGVETEWISTRDLESNPADKLSGLAGIWCVPVSPYANMERVLQVIRFARERRVPFLGTSTGFQYALIEYARNILGWQDADHAESNPAAPHPLIARLPCPLVEQDGTVLLVEGSRLREICGSDSSVETYHCRFGLDRAFAAPLNDGHLRVCGQNSAGDVHAVELTGHPFFIATLFQPERWALRGKVHPLVRSFVEGVASPARPMFRS